jgi:hypothetical protein
MDGTGKTLASGVDAVRGSVASTVTSLSATAAKKTKSVKVPTRQKLSKDENWAETTGEKPNQFRGRGAHASLITIEDEIQKGLKPYGDGIDKTSFCQKPPWQGAPPWKHCFRTLLHSNLVPWYTEVNAGYVQGFLKLDRQAGQFLFFILNSHQKFFSSHRRKGSS